jgi:photosystem II stability/assembly factor-like uncharacterized protein
MLKKFTILLAILFSLTVFAQNPYQWVLKQSGSSLGGPIDYLMYNPFIVYYGSNNTIYKSTDMGDSFTQTGTSVPGASEIKSILLDDDNPGTFLVAIESSPDKILKTSDDGATWTITLNNAAFSYFGIPMTQDPSHPDSIYTMSNTSFYRSTDFGDTWSIISSNFGPISAPCDIEVFADTSIILIGDNGTGIFRSTDYGSTWTQEYTTSGEIPTIAVDLTNPGIAWATKWSGGGGLLKSTDYGHTWTAQNGFNGINMWGVHVQPNDGNVVITGCYSCGTGTWRSKDAGQTWHQIPISSSNYQIAIVDSMNQFSAQGAGFFKLESQFFIPVELTSFTASVVKNNAELFWSTATELNNLGFDIERSYDNEDFEKIGFVPGFGSTAEPKDYSFIVENIVAGIQYYRIRQIDFDGTETIYGAIEVDGPVPVEFALHQNHPNPFNPSTTISFSLPVDSDVKINLYNMLGQVVSEIITKDFQAGTHELEFDARPLASGAYIYTIEAKGISGKNFVSTKKMLLLK